MVWTRSRAQEGRRGRQGLTATDACRHSPRPIGDGSLRSVGIRDESSPHHLLDGVAGRTDDPAVMPSSGAIAGGTEGWRTALVEDASRRSFGGRRSTPGWRERMSSRCLDPISASRRDTGHSLEAVELRASMLFATDRDPHADHGYELAGNQRRIPGVLQCHRPRQRSAGPRPGADLSATEAAYQHEPPGEPST